MTPDAFESRAPRRMGTGMLRCLAACAMTLVFAAAQAQDASTLIIRGKDNWLFPGWGSLTQVDTRGIDANTELVREARDALAARNIKLEVLLLPDKSLFYQDKLPDGKVMSPEVKARYKTILGKLQAAGITTFDDEVILRRIKDGGQDVYYRTDQHWTQVAADATAQATADMIRKDVPNLSGQPGTGLPLGGMVNDRRYGDLADLFLTADERKKIGREVFTVRRPSEGQALLDDAPAPVHVTGHSMMQPYFGFPQKLSNLLDRPVSVNWKPGNVGQWVMLLEYLESPAFKQTKPQVLVWQIFEPAYSQGPDASGLWDNASIMTPDTWRKRLKAATGN
ncbi:alginate O-acetyltransferase AlgX-related protein [Pandoraea fibrosis]|uniref:Twin-arginine translocation pathway signal n=1 Tax=Pandoraea fibrosis TaxID=1891094 RepID=A0A5E4XX16_9BURK|nr:twin-arginine translocation pathway signal [Pandoraea fibrosis]QHF12209.1 twin-arginine translocation pathway signal [Pandoraea fibrosis]VVE40914.1 twin-arginine translocation pathway signal [Pandoraea fibrosis]